MGDNIKHPVCNKNINIKELSALNNTELYSVEGEIVEKLFQWRNKWSFADEILYLELKMEKHAEIADLNKQVHKFFSMK